MTPFKPWEDVPDAEHVALVLPFEPDWSVPVVERLGWKMGAHTSQAGVEHRRNLRREPRQAIEFNTLVTGADVPLLRNVVEAWGARTFAVPLWYGVTRLSADAASGALEIETLDSLETLAQVDGWVILWAGARDFEVMQVSDVGSDFIGFYDPLPAAFAAGVRIAPLQFMQLQANQSLPSPTPTVLTVAWVFEQVPGYAPTLERYDPTVWTEVFPTGVPADDPRNHFLTFAHNWAGQPDVSVSTQADVFDPGVGVLSRRLSVDRTSPQWSLDVLLDDRAKTAQLRQFLSAHRGPAISFWAASPLRDLGLAEDIAGSDLVLENNGQHLAPPVLRMGVHVTHVDGEVRESASAITGTGVTLRNDPGPIALADVWRQSWVSRCRLAIETVSISHLTNRVAQVRLPVMAVDVGSASQDVPTSGTVAGGTGGGLPTLQWSSGAFTRVVGVEAVASATLTLSAALVSDLVATVTATTANGGFPSVTASWDVTIPAGDTSLVVTIPVAAETGGVDLRAGMGIVGSVYTLTVAESSALAALGTPSTCTITSV